MFGTDRQTNGPTDQPKTFKNIQNGFILCNRHLKQFCDRRTDGPTEKWLTESRSTRLKTEFRVWPQNQGLTKLLLEQQQHGWEGS